MSAAPELLRVNESGEIKHAALDEASEFIAVQSFARMMSFSRDLILADHLGAFSDFIGMAARAASGKTGDLLFNALIGSAVMQDGTTFYHANRGNLSATAGALNLANLEAAVIALRSQKDMDGRPAGIVPAHIVCGPRNEVRARQLVAQIQAGQAADVNPYAGLLSVIVEDRITDWTWLVAASASGTAPLGYAVLDGSRPGSTVDGVPQVGVREGWDTLDAAENRVRLDAATSARCGAGAGRVTREIDEL